MFSLVPWSTLECITSTKDIPLYELRYKGLEYYSPDPVRRVVKPPPQIDFLSLDPTASVAKILHIYRPFRYTKMIFALYN